MLHDYAHVQARQTVLILGAAGNVGAYAVQLAANAGLHVVALVGSKDFEYVRGLGAETVIDYHDGNFESSVSPVDVVIDTVGGNTRDRSLHSRWHSGFGCFTDPFAIKLQRANSIFLS